MLAEQAWHFFHCCCLLLLSQVSDELKKTPAAGKLSNADLIALAGAHAVAVCGGPVIDVPVGRVDAAGPDPGEAAFVTLVTLHLVLRDMCYMLHKLWMVVM